ncbi:MAG TPA: hypothetical protein VI072_13140 [Polyangiaceae bacterium]
MRALPVFVSAFSVLLLGAPPSLAQEAERPPARTQPLDEEEASAEDLDAEAGEAEEAPAKPKTPLPGDDVDEDEPEPPLIPAAPDSLGGHLQLSPGAMVMVPFGELADGVSQSSALAAGLGLSLDAGIGVSRSLVLGVWGQFVRFGDNGDCSDCSPTSLAAGAFIRYHLVQGVRFDPWLSAGVGFRTLGAGSPDFGTPDETVSGNDDDARFSGLDFMRFQIGGDWYPTRFLGFGPFVELDSGTYLSRPEGAGDGAVYFHFAAGLRLTLDIPGKLTGTR